MSSILNILSKIFNHHIKTRTITFLILISLIGMAFYNLVKFSSETVKKLTDQYHQEVVLERLRVTQAILNCRSQCANTYMSARPDLDPNIAILVCNMDCVNEAKKSPGGLIDKYNERVPRSIFEE